MRTMQVILNTILSKNIFEYLLVDRSLRVTSASDGIEKYLGSMPQEGDDVLDYLPELVGSEEEVKTIFLKKFCLYSLESVYKNDYYVNITVEYCDENTAIILLHNITANTLSKQKVLQYSNESTLLYSTLQKVVDNQNALLFVTNSEKIEFANKKFMHYFGAETIEQVRKKELNLYQNLDKKLKNYDELFELTNDKEEHIRIGSDTFIVQATLIESIHKLFTLTKVTTLSNEAMRDSLTGAYRKSYFNSKFEMMVAESTMCVLVVMDLDDFKQVNDHYGHQVGDRVLQEFAMLIEQNIRKGDMFVRWGGEEFLLVLQHTSLADAKVKVERIRQKIASYAFPEVGHLTSSFGMVALQEEEDADSIFFRADKALYQAKAAGKNCIVVKED